MISALFTALALSVLFTWLYRPPVTSMPSTKKWSMGFPLYFTCPLSSTSTPGRRFSTSLMCTSLEEANCERSYLTVSLRP